jgi:hypothetical protein
LVGLLLLLLLSDDGVGEEKSCQAESGEEVDEE